MSTFSSRSLAVRAFIVGLALAIGSLGGGAAASTLIPMVDAGGPGGGGGAAVVALPDFAKTSNQRSIELIESTFAPGGVLAGGESEQTYLPQQAAPNVTIF